MNLVKGMSIRNIGGKIFTAPFQAHVYFQSDMKITKNRVPILLNGSSPVQLVHIPTGTARFLAGLNNILPQISRVTDNVYEANLDEVALDNILQERLPLFEVSRDTLTGVRHCFPVFGGNTVEGTANHIISNLKDIVDHDEIAEGEARLIAKLMPDAFLKIGNLYNGLTRINNSFLDNFLFKTVIPEMPKDSSSSFEAYDLAWGLFPETFKGNYIQLSTNIRQALIDLQEKAILEEMFAH